MARIIRKNGQTGIRIDTAEARSKLPYSNSNTGPHWVQITAGTALGYFKGERDSSWYIRQRVGTRYLKRRIGTPDDHVKADGEVVLSHGQAVKLAVTMQLEAREPARPRHYSDGLTLNDVFDKYIEDRKVTPGGRFNRVMAESTADSTSDSWNRHLRDSIGKKLVTALDAAALRKWQSGIVNSPPTKRGKAMEFDPSDPDELRARRSTANRLLTPVKAALTWARKNDLLPSDLADYWRNVSPFNLGDEDEPRMLTEAEVTRLLNVAPADLRELLSGALMTGARLGELRAMKVGDFDSETATVRIYQSKTYKYLRQPLTREGAALFERLTAGRSDDMLIFTQSDGSPWSKSDQHRPMREAVKKAKLVDVSFKTTRATYGKLLLVATKDIEMVARALGHSDSRVTRKHYARYLPNEVAAAVAKLPTLGIGGDNKVARIKRKAG